MERFVARDIYTGQYCCACETWVLIKDSWVDDPKKAITCTEEQIHDFEICVEHYFHDVAFEIIPFETAKIADPAERIPYPEWDEWDEENETDEESEPLPTTVDLFDSKTP